MRGFVFALLALAPTAASAQTAADIARQQWPLQAPKAGINAPATEPVFGGFDHDVSRTVWLRNAPAGRGVAPAVPLGAGAFMSADVARLRDGNSAVSAGIRIEPPYLTARAH